MGFIKEFKTELFLNDGAKEFIEMGDKTKVKIGVYSDGNLLETTTTNFLGPRTFN